MRRGMHLKENLRGIVPDEHLNRLSDRFHVIGDIAVLCLPAESEAAGKSPTGKDKETQPTQ